MATFAKLENMLIRGLVMSENEGTLTLADLRGVDDDGPEACEEPTQPGGRELNEAGGLLDAVAHF